MRKFPFRSLFLLLFITLGGRAQTCQPVESAQKSQLETFIAQWYKLPPNQTITLIDSNTADSACYRKLVFRASVPAPLLTLYVTPDGKHLVTGVMDLSIDPAVARRQKQGELQKQLTAGALLHSGLSSAASHLVVFSDFQCPYCKRFAGFLNELTADERANLQITYRQLPLNIHSWARDAAALGACVAIQDKSAFWKVHDFLFAEQQDISKENLVGKVLISLANDHAIDPSKVASCLKDRSYEPYLRGDEQLATDLGIASTPTIFMNGQKIRVASLDDLRNALKSAATDANTVMTAQNPQDTK